MYNHGQVAACVHIYETVAESIVAMGTNVPSSARMALAGALEARMTTHDMSERAWILRRGLDSAMMSL